MTSVYSNTARYTLSRILHVTPNTEGTGWQVKVQKSSRVLGRFPRKSDALVFARDFAQDFASGRGTRRAFVISHDRFGVIRSTRGFSV